MNITEFMSFDLAWFATLPGILITGGVVVLLIALIFFIASNKKEKNKSAEVVPVENNDITSDINNNFGMDAAAVGMVASQTVPMNNDLELNNGMANVNEAVPAEVPSFDNSTVVPNVVDFTSSVQSTNEVVEGVSNNVVTVPSVEINEPAAPVVPEVAPVEAPASVEIPAVEIPSVEPVVQEAPVEPVAPVVPEVAPAVEPAAPEKPVIYGGVDPANTVSASAPVQPVIYGGANPLENTTTIPRVTNHEAYGASVPSVEPVAQEAPVEPVAPVVPEATPVVEPAIVETPVVEETNTVPSAPEISIEPAVPVVPEVAPVSMPMTGEEMFGSVEPSTSNGSSSEIETLEF
ncbi:MAG: hypothetical protein IJO43_05155 [Bacilli bacterium]|nr:hypothetical protein [Bacilli bacterium]